MTGIEKAPEVRTETSVNERAAEQAALPAFEEKNGRLFTRLQLAIYDCAQGFMSSAAQVVQSFGLIHPKKFGDGRGAFHALEYKYRREGIYRMQQLQSKLTNLADEQDKFAHDDGGVRKGVRADRAFTADGQRAR